MHISHALFQNTLPEDFHIKVATTPEEITQLLEAGFGYVLQKDSLAYFRKRKRRKSWDYLAPIVLHEFKVF